VGGLVPGRLGELGVAVQLVCARQKALGGAEVGGPISESPVPLGRPGRSVRTDDESGRDLAGRADQRLPASVWGFEADWEWPRMDPARRRSVGPLSSVGDHPRLPRLARPRRARAQRGWILVWPWADFRARVLPVSASSFLARLPAGASLAIGRDRLDRRGPSSSTSFVREARSLGVCFLVAAMNSHTMTPIPRRTTTAAPTKPAPGRRVARRTATRSASCTPAPFRRWFPHCSHGYPFRTTTRKDGNARTDHTPRALPPRAR
jgi:hypothetical protein